MIKVIIEFELVYPFSKSLYTLIDFCALIDSVVLYGGSYKSKSVISMPVNHFKRIFKSNPQIKGYNLPSGMEKFVNKVKVKKIVAY